MLEIIAVESGSIADELQILAGDKIIEINGNQVNDQIDYKFYSSEEELEIHILRDHQKLIFEIEKDYHEDLGLQLQEMKMMACGNNCVFCFVYQNPKGMRRALYFKDEDFRFSFLYGHYVTLTTTTQKQLERIVEQNLSPLYISVHATEEKTRKYLLGIKREDHLLQKIEFLIKNGIELHTQIVLCPGINDGKIFDKTVGDLVAYYPGVKSVAVVPVGLTKFRDNLPKLRTHSREELVDKIHYVNAMRNKIDRKISDPFVYLADEFFIRADYALPGSSYYRDFYQIENGVGEFRAMIDEFNANWKFIPKIFQKKIRITWVTGTLAEKNIKTFIIDKLNSIRNLDIDLIAVKNEFYGPAITISGLLVGQDIYNQLKDKDLGDIIFIPPRVLNKDGLFLDDWTVEQLQEKLDRKCYVYTEPIHEMYDVLKRVKVIT